MIITLAAKSRRLLSYISGRFVSSREADPAEDVPTSEEIRALLESSPRQAFEAYLRYREAGGAPHRLRPSEIRRLLSAGAYAAEPVDEPALR